RPLEWGPVAAEERFGWQPADLAAVLGRHRWRHWGDVQAVVVTPDGSRVVSAGDDGVVRVWEAGSGREVAFLPRKAYPLGSLLLPPDGHTLFIGDHGGIVRIWDLAKGKLIGALEAHVHPAHCLALSPDGRTLASGGGGGNAGEVKLWDWAARKLK